MLRPGNSTPQQIAFNEVGRKAIISDPDWNNGDYYGKKIPSRGLALARMVGHITYLSDESMHAKFGRALQGKEQVGFDFSTEFGIESYLHYQGDTFTKRFDANSYLYITKAIDYFDLTKDGSLATGLSGTKAAFLVMSVSSDWLYPPYQSEEIVTALSANERELQVLRNPVQRWPRRVSSRIRTAHLPDYKIPVAHGGPGRDAS